MGIIQPSLGEAFLQDIVSCMQTGLSYYYAFAAGPVAYTGNTVPTLTYDPYTDKFTNNWQMIFGKLLNSGNFLPVVNNNVWTTNSVYTQYDNTSNSLYTNSNFYVVTPPSVVGAPYQFYVCINNANGSPSTVEPTLVQPTTFTTADGYSWRYITSISTEDYNNFASGPYIPVYPNTVIQSSANTYAGIDNVILTNSGNGYLAYVNGSIKSGNSSLVQIDSYAFPASGYYNNSAIYVYQNTSSIGQLRIVSSYVTNTSGNWVQLNTPLSNVSIGSISYSYSIAPQIYFTSDGSVQPSAYAVMNTSSNSIANIVIINNGVNISWTNVSIFTNNALVTTPANAYVVCPPPGGHGYDPVSELNMLGVSIAFNFSNTENSTIPTNIQYNKIGIIKNPMAANSSGGSNNTLYVSNTFNQLLTANVTTTFTTGSQVLGQNSGALGTVAFSNSTVLYLTGDKSFNNSEVIVSTSNSYQNSVLTIVTDGKIYTKSLNPLYISNINNINRSNTQTESYKIVLQI